MDQNERDFLHRQLVRLGDMIGDGMHYEDPSISKEYRRVMKILYPEVTKQKREQKRAETNQAVLKFLKTKKCDCGGEMLQTRDGGMIVKCSLCLKRYQLKWSKKSKK